ncbi:SUKH-4 family immunity protein [Streptomyces sp. NPDC032472]|uniref:SUKH-4 family immunity protein n=1 Tax=Streptomyces sp. NPDC032472 TaxID=3155018 RepID=UPI0033F37414
MPRNDLDTFFSSPAAVLEAGPAELAELLELPDTGGGVGREVFAQAGAVLAGAEVPRAEFASWLHFAAKVLGHDAYADAVAAAEPAMPWRTVWAWWRPVGAYRADPNLSGEAATELYDTADGRVLLKVWSLWTEERWFDAATGEPAPKPAEGEATAREEDYDPDGPCLFDPDGEDGLHTPETWEWLPPLGDDRFLLVEARGIAVVERGTPAPAAGASDASDASGTAERASWGTGEPWFAGPTPNGTPLDADRLEAVFGAEWVVRVPPEQQPGVLTHRPTRELIATAGLPTHWAAGVVSFELAWTASGPKDPQPDADGLLHLGTFAWGDDGGPVLVHPETGAVSMVRDGDGPFPLARDTETFVRLLEAVRRFMGACWDPWPGELGHTTFLREAAELEPLSVDGDEPGGQAWEHLFAGITELSVWGY